MVWKTPCVSYFKNFGSQCFIKKDIHTHKFDVESNEGIFLGYSTKSKAYKCYNNKTKNIIESANVKVDDLSGKSKGTNGFEPEKDDEKLVIIELKAQNNEEPTNGELSAQSVSDDNDEENEEQEAEDTKPVLVLPRYVKLNHSQREDNW